MNRDNRLLLVDRQITKRVVRASRPLSRAGRLQDVRERGLLLGQEGGREVRIPHRELHAHTLILGRSGRGKSKMLEALSFQLILSGHTVIIVDGKGDLYDSVAAFCYRIGKSPAEVVLVNPRASQYVPGLNALTTIGKTSPQNHAKRVLEGLKKVWRETELKPWYEEWAPVALAPLCASGLTLAELEPFVRVTDVRFRQVVLSLCHGSLPAFYHKKWLEMSRLDKQEQATILGVVRTRGSFVWQSPAVLPLLGQRKTTIPWEELLQTPGRVLLAHLGESASLSDEQGRLLGLTMLQQIMAHAWERQSLPERNRHRVFIIIDEASRFVDRGLARAFDLLRGLGVSLIVSAQTLEQLRDEDEMVAASIITNTNLKVIFSTSYRDSEDLAGELFAGHYDFRSVKDLMYRRVFAPKETTRTVITRSSGRTTSRSRSDSSGESASHGESQGYTWVDGQPIFTGSTSMGHSSSRDTSSSSGTTEGESETEGYSESTVPFHELREERELSSRSFWPAEELKEQAIGAIRCQGVQRCVVAWGDNPPIQLKTPTVKPMPEPTPSFHRWCETIAERYGRSRVEVLDEIEHRVEKVIQDDGRRRLELRGREGFELHRHEEEDEPLSYSLEELASLVKPVVLPSIVNADENGIESSVNDETETNKIKEWEDEA